MNTFVEAVREVQVETRTHNGMKTYDSSKSELVDLFFAIGASRGKNLYPQFARAFQEDKTLALRLLMWARDVRGGAGEREVVRQILKNLEQTHLSAVLRLMPHIPEYGRWDDGYCLTTTEGKNLWFSMVKDAIEKGHRAQILLDKIENLSEEECSLILKTMP